MPSLSPSTISLPPHVSLTRKSSSRSQHVIPFEKSELHGSLVMETLGQSRHDDGENSENNLSGGDVVPGSCVSPLERENKNVTMYNGVHMSGTMSQRTTEDRAEHDCPARINLPKCDILLFDLDGTLYGGDVCKRLNTYTQGRILDFLVNETSCPKFRAITNRDQAFAAWKPLIDRYNQTVRGLLMGGYAVDVEKCNRAIREGSEQFLTRDQRLREVLLSLPQRKLIFTNAPESTAETYLEALGLSDCFEGTFGMGFMGKSCCKPEPEAFEKVLNRIGVNASDPLDVGRICFFEDNRRNLLEGKRLGMRTVYIHRALVDNHSSQHSSSCVDGSDFDVVIQDIGQDLPRCMPSLWKA